MRPFSVLVLTACFVLISSASPISEANSGNITGKHEKRKRLRSDELHEMHVSPQEQSNIRNTEKHVLVFNRTMQIFGMRVQEILNDSKRWRVKHDSNKGGSDTIDLSRILKDRSSDEKTRTYYVPEKDRSSEIRPTIYEKHNTVTDIGSRMYKEIKESVENANKFELPNNPLQVSEMGLFQSKNISEKNSTRTKNNSDSQRNLNEKQNSLTSSSTEVERSSEISSLSLDSREGRLSGDIKSTGRSNDTKLKSPTDLIHLDLKYDLEMLNLSEYTTSSLSNTLRDLLDRLSNSDDETIDESPPPCQMWADCRWKLQEILIGSLPSCPCIYPSKIFYDDNVWDNNNQRFYRWKDASGASERLDVYKPGAKHCVRSITTDLYSIAAQHCCYDKEHKLLTRGSGAGSPNLVSPDISQPLHYRIDILPWHHCKGDFTRYNKVRPPNNGNKCSLNPHEEEYQRQIEMATSF